MAAHSEAVLCLKPSVAEKTFQLNGQDILRCTLRRPSCSGGGKAGRRLERRYAALADQCLRYAGRVLLPKAARAAAAGTMPSPWTLALDYAVTLEDEDTLSLYWELTEQAGGGRPVVHRQGDTWRRSDGRPIPLDSLLPDGQAPSGHRLRRAVAEQLRRRLDEGYTLLFPDWERRLKRFFSPEQFYLDSRGVVFFFPLMTVAPYVEGILTVPLSAEYP